MGTIMQHFRSTLCMLFAMFSMRLQLVLMNFYLSAPKCTPIIPLPTDPLGFWKHLVSNKIAPPGLARLVRSYFCAMVASTECKDLSKR